MNYLHEIINFNNNLPIKLSIVSIDKFDMHWHTESELILVIEGSIKIGIQNEIYHLKQNDFILINSNEVHNFNSTNEKNLLLVLQFNPKNYLSLCPKLDKILFKCNSSLSTIEKCDIIRYHIAKIVFEFTKKLNGYQFVIASEINLLIKDIIRNFEYTIKDMAYFSTDEITLAKIQNILEFINKNFTRKISLQEIAEKEKYSTTYLSKFIKKNLGISFYDYLQKIRMNSACSLMIYSDSLLTEIAYQCGFPNYKSFYLLTKKIYGCTPEEYRNENKLDTSLINKIDYKCANKSYLNYDNKIAFKKILDFFEPLNDEFLLKYDKLINSHELITINAKHKGKNYCPSWNKLISFNLASDGLKKEFQNQLKDLQSSIGFENIQFNGMFSDKILIYRLNKNKEIFYDWSRLDELFDFFKKVNIKPFIKLGCMFLDFYRTNDLNFKSDANSHFFENIDLWKKIVKSFINHCIYRYGIKEIETWYFNVCDDSALWYDFGSYKKDDYLRFHKVTISTINSISNNLKIIYKKTILPTINITRLLTTKLHLHAIKQNLILDTCFTAQYIINYSLKSIDKNNTFGYWQFTDLNETTKTGISNFHGGGGLININGLKKASFYAYFFLSKLGNQVLKQRDNYIVTRTNENIQILIYNYEYFNSLFFNKNFYPLTLEELYSIYEKKSVKEIQIKITGLSGKYKITRLQLNKNSGSVFDEWLHMGAPENMTDEELTYLNGISIPKLSIKYLDINNLYDDSLCLPTLGIDLIILEKLFD